MVGRMLVNGAIQKLISGEEEGWLEAARIVIEFAKTVPSTDGPYTVTNTYSSESSESVEGYAAGLGNIRIDDSKKGEHSTDVRNATIERIGYYKLLHTQKYRAVQIWHYRDDEVWRDPDEEDSITYSYALLYSSSGEPLTFGTLERRLKSITLRQKIKALWAVCRYILKYGYSPKINVRLRNYECAGLRVINSIVAEKSSLIPADVFLTPSQK